MNQPSTTALITLMALALWVLGIIARPYTWWKAALVAAMAFVSGLMFVLPVTQRLFLLAPGNIAHTLTALGCAAGILLIELGWWLGGRLQHAR